MDKALVRNALKGMIRATDEDSTPIIRRLARIQARAALENLDAEAASGAGEREATHDEYATVEDWEHDDQRELSLLYKHRADDSLQFNRGQMREAIRHGKRLASLPPATDPAKETIAFVQEWLMSSDHEPTQWDRDFAAAIDARASRQPTDADIRAMAQRFCSTPLPKGVSADLVAIKPMAGRTGTNLLTVEEAAIMLRAALAAAPTIPATGEAIPEGRKAWHGGDGPPDDWDGGKVYYANGQTARPLDDADWQRPADIPLIAYTPKATIPATGEAE